MHWRPLLPLLAVTAVLSIQVRGSRSGGGVHRLVGGHLRIFHEDPHDTDLLITSASGSKDKRGRNDGGGGGGEEKKTLSQQVADGKYGLIQKELFPKPAKRPGVLSYEANPEVPADHIGNLGGLTKNDIWLAENHLLVLKGGAYAPHDDNRPLQQAWPAIDDYKAPTRQVKIPAHPKVPPPFPVQLSDDGPLQILGTNSSRTLNGTEGGLYALPPPEGFDPFLAYAPPLNTDPADAAAGKAALPVPAGPGPGDWGAGSPLPPFLNGTLPPYFASLPPGASILPPPNQSEPLDEDDPSIYYPPPYSFYYPKDNTSLVPAGPLVPGIILPPPPDFFAPLEETTTKKPKEQQKKVRGRITTTSLVPQIRPTTTPVPPTLENRPIRIYPVQINDELKPFTTPLPKVVTILPVRTTAIKNRTSSSSSFGRKPKPSVTILKPVRTTTTTTTSTSTTTTRVPPSVYFNEVKTYKPRGREKTVISTTQIPLKIYYSTSNEIETHSQQPEKAPRKTTKSPTQYYYYEEEGKNEPKYVPEQQYEQSYHQTRDQQPQQQPYYYEDRAKPQYVYVTSRPYTTIRQTSRSPYRFVQHQQQNQHHQRPSKDSFSIHVARLHKQIHQYYTTPRPVVASKPVYQFSYEASNYQHQNEDKFRPLPKYSVQIQPAIEIVPSSTESSPLQYQQQYYNRNPSEETPPPPPPSSWVTERPVPYERSTPRPISQFSFEATPNPIYQGYYTKPDEGYFDENTKKYFTSFGKKLTTPMPPRTRQQRPYSLEGDTNVNYLSPRPTVNPDAEYVNPRYPQVVKYTPRVPPPVPRYVQKPKPPAPNPEIIKAVPVPTAEGQAGSFISYQLPGDDGAHFYFLTPQLAQRRDQGAGYYYESSNQRVRRDKTR